jgi:undecaprenyl phosphate N,N'-diacetylbacillosamine 1-phosphate transferase
MERSSFRTLALLVKRTADIGLCLAVLEVAFPVLLVLVPIVKLSSRGPVFFVQERAGKGGRSFKMYKFRTMAVRTVGEQALTWTADDEARVTQVGRFLRDYGLDELPQLFNILKGDMSIVGPRPLLPEQAANMPDELRAMFEMRPGVLSLAAVVGRRSLPLERRWQLHAEYVKNWSLGLDARILWRSIFVVLGRSDATETL